MPTKSPWEARVGMLLDSRVHPEFVYSYKPFDSPMYGGQPRIDWLACDKLGRFWMLEVKSLDPRRRSINQESDVSPGQRDALNSVATSLFGVPLLLVGQEKMLYVFDWRKILWLLGASTPSLLPLTEASFVLPWVGPKVWALINLYESLAAYAPKPSYLPGSIPIPASLVGSLPSTPAAPSPSILKPRDSIRMRRRKLLSEPSSAK